MTTIDATMRSLEIQGTTVPKLVFGTWQITGPECEDAVRDALDIGYRHLDTARAYGNEAEVGRGMAASGVDRSEVEGIDSLHN
jgi:diketogulonate reductase-like aldo/keto reductase